MNSNEANQVSLNLPQVSNGFHAPALFRIFQVLGDQFQELDVFVYLHNVSLFF
jgi:hypothetical protein